MTNYIFRGDSVLQGGFCITQLNCFNDSVLFPNVITNLECNLDRLEILIVSYSRHCIALGENAQILFSDDNSNSVVPSRG